MAAKKSETPYGSHTKAECQKIALDFARQKYPGFDKAGFRLLVARWDENGWVFGREQFIAYGAVTPNVVNINVSSETGQIQEYCGTRYPVFSPKRPPAVSAAKATALAAKSAGIVNVIGDGNPQLNASYSTLYWRLMVLGKDSKGNILEPGVEVDAYSGAIRATYYPWATGSAPQRKDGHQLTKPTGS